MSTTQIHPSAVVDPRAQLGAGARVGPLAVIGPNVELGDGVVVHPHAIIDGHTKIGADAEIFPGACVGLKPQDLKYDGSVTYLVIGDKTVIRECVTIHPGSTGPNVEGITKVGSGCLIMAYAHVAHDCVIGNGVIIANAAQLAGHVTIEDNVTLGGLTNVHQFVRVGTRAFTGGATRVVQDIPPYCLADGHPARLHGLNVVGLKRAGFSPDALAALKRAYRRIFIAGPFREALAEIEAELGGEFSEVGNLCRFLESSERGVTRAGSRRAGAPDE